MYAVTQDIIDLFNKHYRQVLRITFKRGNVTKVIDETEIRQGGFTIDRYSVSGSKVEVGSAIAAELTLKVKNYDGKYDETIFEGGELFVEVGIKKWDAHRWEQAVIHYIPCGYFIIDTPPRAKSTINISALDRMVKFDKVADLTQITFPTTVKNLITQVCTICGVTVATDLTTLVNYNYTVQSAPTTQSLTYRQLIQWCAFLTATCAYMNHEGKLVFQWYTQTNLPITGAERYSSDMYENDITLTGLVYTGSDNAVYVTGETDYALTYSGCDILQSNIEGALQNIYYAIRNFTYRPYEATIKPAPYIYPMDMIKYKDNKGTVHNTIVTHVTFTANMNTTIAGSGETTTQNDYASNSGLTIEQQQAMQEMKNSIEVTISAEALASLNAIQILANAMGYNLTVVNVDEDTQLFYFHNASTLAASDHIYTLRNGHIAFTDNWNGGNPTWTTTITEANNLLLQVIKQYGLDGSYLDDNSISGDKLTANYKSAVTLEIGQAATGALNSAKAYTDDQMDDAKDYVDTEVAGAKSYADGKDATTLQTAKNYVDGKASDALQEAKDYVDDQLEDVQEYVDDGLNARPTTTVMNAALAEVRAMAKKLYITGQDGTEYAGELKVVNGKPVFEYDTTEGGN